MIKPTIIQTLGDLKREGMGATGHCATHACSMAGGRAIDLDRLIDRLGADWVYVGVRWPVKCARCGEPLQVIISSGQDRGIGRAHVGNYTGDIG